jgi:protein-glutamine gamma-glutamyltransferase
MTAGRTTSLDRRMSCLVLAAIAAGTFQVVRRSSREHWSNVVAELIATSLGFAALYWASRHDDDARPRPSAWLAFALAAFLGLPIVVETSLRTLTGDGEAFELVLLAGMRNAALGSAVLAHRRGFALASYLFSGFLTLFCIAIEDGRAAFPPAALYAVVGLWVLMAAYWERLQGHVAVECHRQTPLRLGVLGGVGVFMVIAASLVAGVRSELVVMPGFFPTSGGQHQSDPYARQGVGDGDMLVAARQQAMSFGPVESGMYLESEMPSLYDMLDDRYGEPLTKARRSGRAVALPGKMSSDRDQTPSESKRSGREFSTVRRKTARTSKRPHGTESNALFYVKGTVPLHLALERYDAFDGATWYHEAADKSAPPLHMDETNDNPWLEFTAAPTHWVRRIERHAVKIINLRSTRLPSPPLLGSIHIDRLNRLNLFRWTPDGVLEMYGRDSIPQFTVIDLVNVVLSTDVVPRRGPPYLCRDDNALWTRLPEIPALAEVQAVAAAWCEGVPGGWSQVEAVIGHLRSDFAHDHDALAPPNCRDVVGHFLRERRGPDYMFANTAALMLRSLGYPTRCVSGFYADPKRYDGRAGQTSVVGDDAHVWLEVAIANGVWVPVEPTPGYEPPRMARTYREMAWDVLAGLGNSIRAHWGLALGAVTLAFIGGWRRRSLLDALACLVWQGRLLGGPRHSVLATLWLLEQRARRAGCGRPRERTLAQWHGPRLLAPGPQSAGPNLSLIQLFDWVLYAPQRAIDCPVPTMEVRRVCREAVRSASLAAMRGSAACSRF